MARARLAVLLSGRGSNFESIWRATQSGELDAEVVVVVSNRPEAPGLEKAREWGIEAHAVDHKGMKRDEHEARVLDILGAAEVDYVILAGYMRLLSAGFVAAFPNRILNIHPSLLPSFPGVDAQRQAFEHGVKVSGCTVHFVDEGLDAGPIVVQHAVPVLDSDDEHTLAARILVEEHKAYVEALVKLTTRAYRIEGRRVVFS